MQWNAHNTWSPLSMRCHGRNIVPLRDAICHRWPAIPHKFRVKFSNIWQFYKLAWFKGYLDSCRKGVSKEKILLLHTVLQGPVVKKDLFRYGPKNSRFRENSPFSLMWNGLFSRNGLFFGPFRNGSFFTTGPRVRKKRVFPRFRQRTAEILCRSVCLRYAAEHFTGHHIIL